MCEVTKYNFNDKYNEIEEALKNAVFISIDCEFSALHIKKEYQGSLFDTPQQRYFKIRKNLEQAIPLEIGLTAFTFNRDANKYSAKPYKFYLFPAHFGHMYKTFVCQSSAFHFLGEHKFDFNKFVYSGISFLNRTQELEIKKLIDEKRIYQYCTYSLESGGKEDIDELIEIVWKWFRNERNSNEKTLCDINTKNYSFIYWLHNDIRKMSKQSIWTYEENQQFKVKRVTPQEYKQLNKEYSLEKNLLTTLLGFTKIFRLLSDLKKPIVGHNFLNDLVLIINTFDNPVPASYNTFKNIAHNFFPCIFDTKTINFELLNCIDQKKQWKVNNGLQDLYHFFKNGGGRHLVSGSPMIEINEEFDYYTDDKFHDAGWDSYCTGYCFIRMAHCFAALNYEEHVRKTFMHSELLKAVDCFKNKVNVIRATTPYLNLSGADPASRRPPCLIIQSTTCKPVDIFKVTELIRECGPVDVKPHSWGGQTAIASVGNYGSVNRILKKYEKNEEFKILTYNPLRHSPIIRIALWSSALVSGGFLAWIIHKQITKCSG